MGTNAYAGIYQNNLSVVLIGEKFIALTVDNFGALFSKYVFKTVASILWKSNNTASMAHEL